MTSELLLICDRIEKQESMWHLSSWATIDEVKTVAAYAKSRLQAEAQAPTTAVDRSAALENTDDAAPAIVLAAVRACAASWVPEARILGNVRAGDIVRALTTTAALTEDALHDYIVTVVRQECDPRPANYSGEWDDGAHDVAARVVAKIKATVGAPAPAPTTWRPKISELRHVIDDATERFNRDVDQLSDRTGYIASALLGFIETSLRPSSAPTGETTDGKPRRHSEYMSEYKNGTEGDTP